MRSATRPEEIMEAFRAETEYPAAVNVPRAFAVPRWIMKSFTYACAAASVSTFPDALVWRRSHAIASPASHIEAGDVLGTDSGCARSRLLGGETIEMPGWPSGDSIMPPAPITLAVVHRGMLT